MKVFSWYMVCYTYYLNGEPYGQGDVTFNITTPKFTARNLDDVRSALAGQIREQAQNPDLEVTVHFNSLVHLCDATEEEFYH